MGIEVDLKGNASKLNQTWESLVYFLMTILFVNFLYPLIILFTLPLATAKFFRLIFDQYFYSGLKF